MTKFTAPEDVKLPRVTKGKRPSFFDDPAIDQLMTFTLELMTEVAVLRERLDTHERVLDRKGTMSTAEIEAYHPDEKVETDRFAWREAYVRRVLRMHGHD